MDCPLLTTSINRHLCVGCGEPSPMDVCDNCCSDCRGYGLVRNPETERFLLPDDPCPACEGSGSKTKLTGITINGIQITKKLDTDFCID